MDTTHLSPTGLSIGLIKGLSYAYPTSGSIRLGHAVIRKVDGQPMALPVMDDGFTLTTKVRAGDGSWERHPLDAPLRERYGVDVVQPDGSVERKLRSIPVTVVFDRPDLNMVEQFAAFNGPGSPLCVGNGVTAKRRQADGDVTQEPCAGPGRCAYGAVHRCEASLRLLVRVEGQAESEPPFVLRSGSVNAITDNRATLEHLHGLFKGRLAGLPFRLELEAKQSALSAQSVFYFVRLEAAFGSIKDGASWLAAVRTADEALGIDRAAAEDRLMQLRANGAFAEDPHREEALANERHACRATRSSDLNQDRNVGGSEVSAAQLISALNERLTGAACEGLSTRPLVAAATS